MFITLNSMSEQMPLSVQPVTLCFILLSLFITRDHFTVVCLVTCLVTLNGREAGGDLVGPCFDTDLTTFVV